MRLIGLVIILALSLTRAPLAAEAQQAGRPATIGYLGNSSPTLESKQDVPTTAPTHPRGCGRVRSWGLWASDEAGWDAGGVPSRGENIRNGAFFRLVKLTTNVPPARAAIGGTRRGQECQEAGWST